MTYIIQKKEDCPHNHVECEPFECELCNGHGVICTEVNLIEALAGDPVIRGLLIQSAQQATDYVERD